MEQHYDDSAEMNNVETQGGSWGRRSRKEVCAVVFVALVAIAGITIALVSLSMGNDDGSSSSSSSNSNSAAAAFKHPQEPTILIDSPQKKLTFLRERFADFDLSKKFLEVIPDDAESLISKHEVAFEPPEVRAASWLVHKDSHNEQYQLARRFALATVYYANGGASWTNSTGWLSDNNHCEWKGIRCCGESSVQVGVAVKKHPIHAISEIDLDLNNVSGKMQDVLVLLQELEVLYFRDNALTGEINGALFTQLPELTKVYLQYNQLTGTIPKVLADNGKLNTIFMQGNKLTGDFPVELCPSCKYCEDRVTYFGIDCPEVNCEIQCCTAHKNCFYTSKELD